VTDDALIEEVRHRGFTIRDAQISPKREWVGLTDEERKDIELGVEVFDMSVEDILKEAEAKLKEKNT
jgi:hypothetical protein